MFENVYFGVLKMVGSKSYKEGRGSTTLSRKAYYSSRTSRESEMPDIRTVRAKSMKEAIALATIEYGRDFSILNNKTVKTGGMFGIGKKEEIELRIMLLHNRADANKASKIESDKKEIKKHEPIDAKEMGERLLQIRQNIENANAINNTVDEANVSIVDSVSANYANVNNNNNYDEAVNNYSGYSKEYISSDNVALRHYTNDDEYYNFNNKNDIDNNISDMTSVSTLLNNNNNNNIVKGSSKTENVYSYIDSRMDSFEDKILSALSQINQNTKLEKSSFKKLEKANRVVK